MRRVVVVGVTGSGKSTLGAQLAQTLSCPFVELDALYWGPNWTEAPVDAFRARVDAALAGDDWVVGGNYSKARDIIWTRADTLIWLDLPLWLTFGRVLRRSLQRIISREDLWGTGNRETWRNIFFNRNSLLLWAIKTHFRNRHAYPRLLNQPTYAHLTVHRLRSRRAIAAWLNDIQSAYSHEERLHV